MADLSQRAQDQLAHFQTLLNEARDRLGDAHAARAQAEKSVATAREALADDLAAEQLIRQDLATATTPGVIEDLEVALRENLIAQAAHRTDLRDATTVQRTAIARIAYLRTPADMAVQALRDATSHASTAAGWQLQVTTLTGLEGTATAAQLAAEADTLLNASVMGAATSHLNGLLPAELRDRATARLGEARDSLDQSAARATAVSAALDDERRFAHPVDSDVDVATVELEQALDQLRRHLTTASGRIAHARTLVADVTALAPLTPEEQARLTVVADAAAVATEAPLDDAVAAWRVGRVAFDGVVVDTILADPDTDPLGQSAMDAPRTALQGLVDDIAIALGGVDTDAVDEWEVEVRPEVWAAHRQLDRLRLHLQEVAEPTHAAGLRSAVADATDELAQELDQRDQHRRRLIRLALERADRQAEADAADRLAEELLAQRHRGDGTAGLGASQLTPVTP